MTQKVVDILDAAQNMMQFNYSTSKLQQIVVKLCSSTKCSLSLPNTGYSQIHSGIDQLGYLYLIPSMLKFVFGATR